MKRINMRTCDACNKLVDSHKFHHRARNVCKECAYKGSDKISAELQMKLNPGLRIRKIN